MSTRRSFFGKLLAAVAVPFIPLPKVVKSSLLGYRGREMLGRGIVYAPYIPLLTTKTLSVSDFPIRTNLMSSMSSQIQAEIDRDLINRMVIYHDNHH